MITKNIGQIPFTGVREIKQAQKTTDLGQITFKELQNDSLEIKNNTENKWDQLETNREIHRAKVTSSLFSALLACLPPFIFGFVIPSYYLLHDAKDMADPKAPDMEKELIKKERLRQAKIESSMLAAAPFLGLVVPLTLLLFENPEDPKPMFMSY